MVRRAQYGAGEESNVQKSHTKSQKASRKRSIRFQLHYDTITASSPALLARLSIGRREARDELGWPQIMIRVMIRPTVPSEALTAGIAAIFFA